MLLLAGSSSGHNQPRSLDTPETLSPCSTLISGTFPYFPDISSSHNLHLLLPGPPFLFPRLLLPFENPSSVHHLFFPGPYTPSFPNLDHLSKEAQHTTGLPICGFLSSLFLNWKIQDVTFCLVQVLQKFIASPHQLQLASRRLL